MAEKCNNALAENAVLVLEINEYRREFIRLFQEISELRSEIRKITGSEPETPNQDLEPMDCGVVVKKRKKVPVPKSVKKKKTTK